MAINKLAYFLKVICTVIVPQCLDKSGSCSQLCRSSSFGKIETIINFNHKAWAYPCSDYYENACSYVEENPDSFTDFVQERNRITEEIFSSFIENEDRTDTEDEASGLKMDIRQARRFFHSCIAGVRSVDIQKMFIGQIMDEIGLPTKPPFNGSPDLKYSYAKILAKLQRSGLLDQYFLFETKIIRTEVLQDVTEKQTFILIKTFPSRFDFPKETVITEIVGITNEMMCASLNEEDQIAQFNMISVVDEFFHSTLKNIYLKRFIPVTRTEQGAERTAESSERNPPSEDILPPLNKSIKLSISKLEQITGEIYSGCRQADIQINWHDYFEALFQDIPGAEQLDKNTQNVIIENYAEFKEILTVIAITNKEIFIAALWTVVMQPIILLFGAARWPQVTYLQLMNNGDNELFRKLMCQLFTEIGFPQVMIHALEKKLDAPVREKIRTEVDTFVSNIKNSFKNVVSKASWLDETSTQFAQEKIENLSYEIPYWERSETKSTFDIVVKTMDLSPGNFHTFIRIMQNKTRKNMAILFEPNTSTSKKFLPRSLNTVSRAFVIYHPLHNHLEISAGSFGYPLYGYGNKAIDLGILGFWIAYEMANAIAIQDERWSPIAIQKYRELIDCFGDQYTSFTNPQSTDFKRWKSSYEKFPTPLVNGAATAVYNLRDTIAYKVIDQALFEFPSASDDETPLGRLSKFQSRQLLTVSFATVFCRNVSNLIMPNPWRIRGTLIMNADIFAETWKCKANDRMVVTRKCQPWL